MNIIYIENTIILGLDINTCLCYTYLKGFHFSYFIMYDLEVVEDCFIFITTGTHTKILSSELFIVV